ncbi:condensin complex protein MksE [Saccharospirillum salsuginis]|uniref:Uncharacterized protein n=1 Tax=Saccharospirillum salsuginis TaxID=418750 RepID=A0A918K3Z6_9GAMM|nr:hypothetical protein [Saccharospirillum salsuginis]GGX47834.1 hypothetical protein GCM10007392_13380 [Saccharospirillum salsuginis]
MSDHRIDLAQLPSLADLFRLFNNGKHLNRQAEPALWAELEREQTAYQAIFEALGYDLRIDGRGFAWFHTDEATSATNKATRQLALLFMVLFDTQADAGKPLMRFGDWVIDSSLLKTVHEQHQELLVAEGIEPDGLVALFETAQRFGFALAYNGHWRLLPAVCRYLDHYEELANVAKTEEVVLEENDDEGEQPL